MDALPFKDYFSPNGAFNLSSRLPDWAMRADLSPRINCSYASKNSSNPSDSQSKGGFQHLQVTLTDHLDLLTYGSLSNTESPKAFHPSAFVIWDVYKGSEAEKIQAFLIRSLGVSKGSSKSVYMDTFMREKLFQEESIRGHRIYQNPGDMILIPGGSIFQNCSLRDSISVSMKALSLENSGQVINFEERPLEFPGLISQEESSFSILSTLWWSWKVGMRRLVGWENP